jgi:hypothetical protein
VIVYIHERENNNKKGEEEEEDALCLYPIFSTHTQERERGNIRKLEFL